jgi:hypothetical protein
MKSRRVFLGGVAAVAGLALSGCEKLQKTGEAAEILLNQGKGAKRWPNYRYRLTVEVETPEGLKTGSSVIEVRTAMSGPNNIPTPGSLFTEIRGEAAAVDLGNRGYLFALLRSEQNLDWAHGALLQTVPALTIEELRQLPADADDFDIWMERLLAVPFEQKRALPRYVRYGVSTVPTSGPPNGYPMLVQFDDPTTPATVKQVDADNLAAHFGDGVKLKSMSVTRTEAEVSKGIEKNLAWLKELNGGLAKVPPMSSGSDVQDLPLAFHLSDADFSYGVIK